jgi:hypothetical protein
MNLLTVMQFPESLFIFWINQAMLYPWWIIILFIFLA